MDKSRVIAVELLFAAVFFVVVLKTFSLQVIHGEDYRQAIASTRRSVEVMTAPRGRILDRNGNALAYDEMSFDLYVTPEDFEKDRGGLGKLASLLGVGESRIANRVEAIDKQIESEVARRHTEAEQKKLRRNLRQTLYHEPLVRDIPLNPVALAIDVHPEIYAGLSVKQNLRRRYPYGNIAAQTIGYVGRVRTKEEFEKLAEQNYFTEGFEYVIGEDGVERLIKRGTFDGEMIGRAGVELWYNDTLRHYAGLQAVEKTKDGIVYNVLVQPQQGKDIQLTIDANIQRLAQESLAGHGGAAVVMDVHSGEIIVLVSMPTFNNNDFIPPVPADIEAHYFSKTSAYPTVNRAISGEYQVGSVFKVITSTAGLIEKKITPETQFTCTGKFSDEFEHFKCWVYAEYQKTHGTVDLKEAIQHSCNIFFFNVGKITGIDAISRWATNYGLGSHTGIDLYGEESGLVPTEQYREKQLKNRKRKWLFTDTLNIAIGQGELSATPIQIARMMAAVANGGVLITPKINKDAQTAEPVRLDIPQNVLDAIKDGLYAVVHEDGGTAYNSGLRSYDCAGKTSTAQTVGEKAAHGWFAGFAPYKEPKYAFAVLVEYGGSGAQSAAPVATKILEGLAVGKE